MTKKVLLPIRAYKFIPIEQRVSRTGTGVSMQSLHTIANAQVTNFVEIKEDGTLNYDLTSPQADKPLFLLKVKPNSGPSFHVVTDGDIYYPFGARTHLIYDPAPINAFGPLSVMDQMLIREAIRYFSSMFA